MLFIQKKWFKFIEKDPLSEIKQYDWITSYNMDVKFLVELFCLSLCKITWKSPIWISIQIFVKSWQWYKE